MSWEALLNPSSSMKQGSQGSLISLTGRINGELDKALDTVPGNGKCLLNTGCQLEHLHNDPGGPGPAPGQGTQA